MFGLNSIVLPVAVKYRISKDAIEYLNNLGIGFYSGGGKEFVSAWSYIIVLSIIAFFLPNTLRLMRLYRPVISINSGFEPSAFTWRLTTRWAIFTSIVFIISVLALTRVSEFLYFQF
jgi:hypothetical protein